MIYQLSGYMTVQRQVDASWRDYVWLPDVVLMPFDTAVTTVAISATSMQVARGSSISNTDGHRRRGCLNYGPIAQVGPVKGKDGKNELKPSVWGDLPSMKLDAKCSASGKLYGRVCHQEKW